MNMADVYKYAFDECLRLNLRKKEYRTITKFLLLPLKINNKTRWLQWARIRQQKFWYPNRWGGVAFGWENKSWKK